MQAAVDAPSYAPNRTAKRCARPSRRIHATPPILVSVKRVGQLVGSLNSDSTLRQRQVNQKKVDFLNSLDVIHSLTEPAGKIKVIRIETPTILIPSNSPPSRSTTPPLSTSLNLTSSSSTSKSKLAESSGKKVDINEFSSERPTASHTSSCENRSLLYRMRFDYILNPM